MLDPCFVRCLLWVVRRPLSVVGCPLWVVRCELSVVGCLLRVGYKPSRLSGGMSKSKIFFLRLSEWPLTSALLFRIFVKN